MTTPTYLATLEPIVLNVIAPAAAQVDKAGAFPRAALDALSAAGLLGLVSATEVGGMGLGMRAAAMVVERIAQACGSTAMVVCMHYAAAAVIEAHGSRATREAIAAGKHVSTLAFSEVGSRSQFWAPTSSAARENGHVRLNAMKSWVTSAGEADSYVWSSRPMTAEGASSLWLMPADAAGLTITAAYDGIGLRGNASSPIAARDVTIDPGALLGADGKGFDVMMGVVLPYFCLMNAAMSVGNMEAAFAKSVAHVSGTRFAHVDSALSDLPTIRAYVARMRIKIDMARTLVLDALDALEGGRADGMLRVLEVKAAAGETALEVTELAMRVCGGAAYRKDVGVDRSFRDARAASVMAPTTDVLYDFIGKAVCGMPLF
jgi:alkylation response protein AidB-like acyl-CoA dehydrogenase